MNTRLMVNPTPMSIDAMRAAAQPGKAALVASDMFTRGGQAGEITEVFTDGVAIEFGCDPSEHWAWEELQSIS